MAGHSVRFQRSGEWTGRTRPPSRYRRSAYPTLAAGLQVSGRSGIGQAARPRRLWAGAHEKLVVTVSSCVGEIPIREIDERPAGRGPAARPEVDERLVPDQANTRLRLQLGNYGLLLGAIESQPPLAVAHLDGPRAVGPQVEAVHSGRRDQ